MSIYNTVAPALPLSPFDYDQRQQDQFQSVLRLYFNRLDSTLSALAGATGGGLLGFPHIAASDSTDQLATATNTPTVVSFNTLDSGLGFTLTAPGKAIAEVSGVYKITYSAQLANTANGIHDATFWLKVNNTNVANSTTIFTVGARKSAGVPTYVAAYSEVVFPMNAGDTVALWWGTTQAASSGGATGVYILSKPAQTTPMAYPATPSAIGSITFVSALL